jgi:hypothetical protein
MWIHIETNSDPQYCLQDYGNVPPVINKQKVSKRKLIFVGIFKATEEKCWLRIRKQVGTDHRIQMRFKPSRIQTLLDTVQVQYRTVTYQGTVPTSHCCRSGTRCLLFVFDPLDPESGMEKNPDH